MVGHLAIRTFASAIYWWFVCFTIRCVRLLRTLLCTCVIPRTDLINSRGRQMRQLGIAERMCIFIHTRMWQSPRQEVGVSCSRSDKLSSVRMCQIKWNKWEAISHKWGYFLAKSLQTRDSSCETLDLRLGLIASRRSWSRRKNARAGLGRSRPFYVSRKNPFHALMHFFSQTVRWLFSCLASCLLLLLLPFFFFFLFINLICCHNRGIWQHKLAEADPPLCCCFAASLLTCSLAYLPTCPIAKLPACQLASLLDCLA